MPEKAFAHRALIVTGTLDRAILQLGAPAALAALLQAGFLVVDIFWLGRVGGAAIAAASTAGFVMWLAQALGEGAATGAGALVARAVGAQESPAVQRATAAGLATALWGSLLVAAVGLALTPAVFAFMGTAPDVAGPGKVYLRIILAGMPLYFAFVWMAAAFRAVGDSRTPVRLLLAAGGLHLLADPLLIFGLGPLPGLGVAGAALSTVGSWLAACLVGFWRLHKAGMWPQARAVLRPSREIWKALRIGLPIGAEGAFFSVIYIFLTRITSLFGTPAVAALGIGHKLEVLNYFVCAGMGAAATTMVGQNLGAGDVRRAARAGWRTLFLTLLPVGAVTTALVALPAQVTAVFTSDPAVIALVVLYVLIVGMSEPFMAFEVVLIGAFAGAHRTLTPALVQISLSLARVPLAWWLVSRGWGVEAVWAAIAITCALKGLVLAIMFALWQRRALPAAKV